MNTVIHTTQLENIPAELVLSEFAAIRAQLDKLFKQVAPKEPQDEYLTRDEVAALLKVSKVTVWNWSQPNAGILTPRRIGNQIRYLKSEVVAAAKATGKESRQRG